MRKFLSVFAAVALFAAPSFAMTDIVLGTGTFDKNYNKVGRQLQSELADLVKIKPVVSKGSIDNIERMDKNEFNAGLTQMDALIGVRKILPGIQSKPKTVMKLYDEYVHMLCNTKIYSDSRVTGLMDTTKYKIAVDSPKSGSNATWQAITVIEPRYGNVPTTNLGDQEALQAVIGGEVACMVFVSGLNSDLLKDANQAAGAGATIQLVSFDDKYFFNSDLAKYDGQPIYEKAELPKDGNYRNITGWSKPNTLKVGAMLIVSQDWYMTNKDEYGMFLRNVRNQLPGINDTLTGKKK